MGCASAEAGCVKETVKASRAGTHYRCPICSRWHNVLERV
jgi:hypothetical protein